MRVSPYVFNFWEPDRKGGYKTKIKKPSRELAKEGLKAISGELSKLKEEIATKFRCDNLELMLHGDYEIVWKFSSEDIVNSWVVTADSDHNEGHSKAGFVLGANQKGIFRGNLNTKVQKDGKVRSAGYCNIRSPKNMISFKRLRPYDWQQFTHLVLALRGDGRVYQVLVHMDRYFDLQWHDQYNYPLYTRGGPYWQITKIPFSKFFVSGKGRVQDKQEAVQLDRVASIGITIADANSGPFNLELDFIGLLYDENHVDTFEYEMYPVSPSVFC
jgi:NADH dehydrogenase [ubiquinone] 1 alpha subcomplex assembly factor 1